MYRERDKTVRKEADHKNAEGFGHKVIGKSASHVEDIWEDVACSLGRLDHMGHVMPRRQKTTGGSWSEWQNKPCDCLV